MHNVVLPVAASIGITGSFGPGAVAGGAAGSSLGPIGI